MIGAPAAADDFFSSTCRRAARIENIRQGTFDARKKNGLALPAAKRKK
jgi:hypothetical protein